MERRNSSILKKDEIKWHPQRKTLRFSSPYSSKRNSEDRVLDPKTKAEVETRVAIHIRPEQRIELFKQEGVTRNQYTRPTVLHRLKDSLNF